MPVVGASKRAKELDSSEEEEDSRSTAAKGGGAKRDRMPVVGASSSSSASASTFTSASAPPRTPTAARDGAKEALIIAVGRDGRVLHDVPSDHYCLYWSLLHAFSTQLPPAHQAHVEAIGHLQNDHPARSFLLDLAQSMETNDLLHTIWDLEGNERNDIISTLEQSILEKAAEEDFKRGEGRTMASLLNKMRSGVTKPWGTELILTYFILSLYDVGVRVIRDLPQVSSAPSLHFYLNEASCVPHIRRTPPHSAALRRTPSTHASPAAPPHRARHGMCHFPAHFGVLLHRCPHEITPLCTPSPPTPPPFTPRRHARR